MGYSVVQILPQTTGAAGHYARVYVLFKKLGTNMTPLNSAMIDNLRVQIRSGTPLSRALRPACDKLDKLVVIQHVRAAFALSLHQIGPLAGWSALQGELSDAQLDELLMPEIEENRAAWDGNVARTSA